MGSLVACGFYQIQFETWARADKVEGGKESRSEVLADDCGEGGLLSATSVRPNKRPFKVMSPQLSSPEGAQGDSEGMERLAMGGISGSDDDARVGTADPGVVIGELDDRALGIRGENACSEAVAAGNMVAGETDATQGTSGDGDGVGGDIAAMEVPNRSTMNRNQWRRFKKLAAAKLQGRK